MKIAHKAACYLKSMRYVECGGAALTALEGYWLSVHRFDLASPAVLLAMAAVACGAGFANVLNDMLDRDADRINHPQRPILRGELGLAEAGWLAATLFVLSALLSLLAGWRMFLLVAVGLILAAIYNLWAKNLPLLGNLIVAAALALLLLTGYCITDGGDLPAVPALAALLFLLARELLKSVSDAAGDRLAGRRSLAILWGPTRVLQCCLALTALAGALLIIPAATMASGRGRIAYLLTMMLILVLPTLISAVAIWRDQSLPTLRFLTNKSGLLLLASLITLLWLV